MRIIRREPPKNSYSRMQNVSRLLIVLALMTALEFEGAGATGQPSPADGMQWIAEGGVTTHERNGTIELIESRGWIRLNTILSDFLLEFDFQLPTDRSSAGVSIRSYPGYARSAFPFRGYNLLLSNTGDFGRLQAEAVSYDEPKGNLKPAVRPAGEWQHGRIEARRDALTITLNDALPLRFEGLDEFAGYLALHPVRGHVLFRDMRLTRMPSSERQFELGILRASAEGVRRPKVVREVKPIYPKEPHDEWIQGTVSLEVVVQPDGSVGDIRVIVPKHRDLDLAAMAAVRKWRFTPAHKDESAIPVIVSIDISFTRTR
jgi:TonB family protein